MSHDLLWSRHIVSDWIEGLPIGNGRIGTMVTGSPGRECLTLNHDDLWHRLVDRSTMPVSRALSAVREKCREGKWEEAQALMMEKLQPFPAKPDLSVEEYQLAGDLQIGIDLPDPVKRYRRVLDLATGIAEITFDFGQNGQRRRYCASAVDDVIALEIRNRKPHSLQCQISLSSRIQKDMRVHIAQPAQEGIVGFTVHGDRGFDFSVASRILVRGGAARFEQGRAVIRGADRVTVLTAIVTGDDSSPSWEKAATTVCTHKSTDHLFRDSMADHRKYYERVALSLGRARRRSPSAEAMLCQASQGKPRQELFELLFKMGRYLMIASSRPGTNPINLQGIWNNNLHPSWQADWHLDVNVQMCYWLSESCNLSEFAMPLFEMIEKMIPTGMRNASDLFGCRGVFFPIACSRDSVALPGWWVAWTGAAGWLAQHLWQHYEYTGDVGFLKVRVYPFIKEVLEFYEDYLIPDRDETLMVLPSLSPENVPSNRTAYLCKNAVSDIAIISELLRNGIRSASTLGIDVEMIPKWEAMRAKLPAWPMDQGGALKEWADPTAEETPNHRHFSHLYPVYPGDLFTVEDTPELAQAASKALKARESHGYQEMAGWSYPNLAALHARLGQGNEALQSLEYLTQSCLLSNLLTVHNDWRFQGLSLFWDYVNTPRLLMVDAILGTTAAIAEMLLQSQGGLIRILPALPDVWADGHVDGLKARGGFAVGIDWKSSLVRKVNIKSCLGNPCRLKLSAGFKEYLLTCNDLTLASTRDQQGNLCFETEQGREYRIVVDWGTQG